MSGKHIQLLIITLLLMLLQVTILNRFQLFGWGTPYLFIYGLIKLPVGTPRWATLTAAFSAGFLLDLFSNTPGLNAGTLTVVAMLRPVAVKLFFPKDIIGSYMPSPQIVGRWQYWRYTASIVVLHHTLLVFAELFTFAYPLFILGRIVCSIIATLFFFILFELSNRGKIKR